MWTEHEVKEYTWLRDHTGHSELIGVLRILHWLPSARFCAFLRVRNFRKLSLCGTSKLPRSRQQLYTAVTMWSSTEHMSRDTKS